MPFYLDRDIGPFYPDRDIGGCQRSVLIAQQSSATQAVPQYSCHSAII
jgi:hypothetical protein